jgi:hypothetical protein
MGIAGRKMTIDMERRIELERADAARKALDEAVKRIENLDGNPLYQKAWKVAVQSIKGVKL